VCERVCERVAPFWPTTPSLGVAYADADAAPDVFDVLQVVFATTVSSDTFPPSLFGRLTAEHVPLPPHPHSSSSPLL